MQQEIPLNIDKWKDVWLAKGFNIAPVPGTYLFEINEVQGFLTPGDIGFLWNMAAKIPQGGSYLEIGSWMGLSSIVVANSLLAALNLNAKVYCVDTWEGSTEHQDYQVIKDKVIYDIFLGNVAKSRMEHFITPKRGPSLEVVHQFADRSLDAIFIDGDHSYEGCLADIRAWHPKLKPGGQFFGHDAMPGSAPEKAALDYAREKGLSCRIVPSPQALYMWIIE